MNLSEKGAAFIRAHEGFVAKYYLDPVGIPTIGIGFTWRSASFQKWWAANKDVPFNRAATMTKAEAEHALVYLVAHEYGKAVNDYFGTLKQHEFDGASSVVYNCGAGTLGDRWADALKKGNIATAAAALEGTRITAKGKRLAGLVRRRKEEAALIQFAKYGAVAPSEPTLPGDALADGMLTRGERGPAVAALISDLTALGFYEGVQDDVFGYGTEAAVLAFQRWAGLAADGGAGPKTLAAVAAAVAKRGPVVVPDKKNWIVALIEAIVAMFTKKG